MCLDDLSVTFTHSYTSTLVFGFLSAEDPAMFGGLQAVSDNSRNNRVSDLLTKSPDSTAIEYVTVSAFSELDTVLISPATVLLNIVDDDFFHVPQEQVITTSYVPYAIPAAFPIDVVQYLMKQHNPVSCLLFLCFAGEAKRIFKEKNQSNRLPNSGNLRKSDTKHISSNRNEHCTSSRAHGCSSVSR